VISSWRWFAWVAGLAWLAPSSVVGQIDPIKRELIQFGYNAALQGHSPLSAYAFYYRNQPDFLHTTNLTLRLALAPTYLDSELGISHFINPQTDLGIGLAGGGFADSYNEIRQGKYLPKESFDGYGGQVSLSLYHLFNPGQRIPLNGVLRGTAHYSTFDPTGDTAKNFQVPEDLGFFSIRTGLRFGGREPTLFPSLAMELSIWYQGEFRSDSQHYGFDDRRLNPDSHLFWAEAFLAYTLPKWQHTFSLNLTAGTSIDADRFSAYRLGGFLPMASEFPLALPGYYYQEISAREFVLLNANYMIPLDKDRHWNVDLTASTAQVQYLEGLEQPGHWHSGVGVGVLYGSPTWRVMVGYGYGVDAIRSSGRGAHSISFLLQFDLIPAKEAYFKYEQPGPWRGLQRVLGVFGS
jgi:hypothetical protein